MNEKLQFQFELGTAASERREDAPLRVIVIGDFSGDSPAGRPPLAQRKPVRVDVDNLWQVASAFEPRCKPPAGDVDIQQLEDFNPDSLFERLKLFTGLREKRMQPAPTGDDSPLAALLGGKSSPQSLPKPASDPSAIDALIHQAIAAHIVPDTSAQDRAWRQAIDAAIGEQMRALLHDPAFQSLEANWRGVDWLVSSLDWQAPSELCLLDVSRAELESDLGGATSMHDSKVLAAIRAAGRWSALICLESFEPHSADIGLLASLGAVGSLVGGPCIANAGPALWTGDPIEDSEAWQLLRDSEVATWIGLVAPRLLMRQPYGQRSNPIDAFNFEELSESPEHTQFLWAAGALGFALLLGRSYQQAEGWGFTLGEERELDGLPMFTVTDRHGDKALVPCAEAFLSDAEAEALYERGLMALVSHRHQNAALLHRFRSLSSGDSKLGGLPC